MSEATNTDNIQQNESLIPTPPDDNPQSGKLSSTDKNRLILGLLIVCILTGGTTYVVGDNWGRWGAMSASMAKAGNVLNELPKELPNWIADDEDQKLSQNAIEQLEVANYVVRRYTNRSTQERVSLIIMIGPTGRLVVHTPEICFGGRNYRAESSPIPATITYEDPNTHEPHKDVFRKLVFHNQAMEGGSKVFYYGVSVGGPWMEITGSSRSDLQKYRFLYKLQMEAFVPSNTTGDNDVIARFLSEFLPAFSGKLVQTKY